MNEGDKLMYAFCLYLLTKQFKKTKLIKIINEMYKID